MTLESDLEDIREGLRASRFTSEAAVSRSVVMRLLSALGWNIFDPEFVSAEYSVGTRRVDYALCNPRRKPFAFVEVKGVGLGDGAERQLFEYAFHQGVQLAILTDGREWNFFLPAEQGDYGERRVYRLDLVDRDLLECVARLRRYLGYAEVVSGAALSAAREDYRDVTKDREMQAALPRAWNQLLSEADERLLELIADRVETLCGFRPTPDTVAGFLRRERGTDVNPLQAGVAPPALSIRGRARDLRHAGEDRGTRSMAILAPIRTAPSVPTLSKPSSQSALSDGMVVDGMFRPARSAISALQALFELLGDRDPSFLQRFAELPTHGRTRRYLARDPADLYPGNPSLQSYSARLASGWWLSTNHSRNTIRQIGELALRTALPHAATDVRFEVIG